MIIYIHIYKYNQLSRSANTSTPILSLFSATTNVSLLLYFTFNRLDIKTDSILRQTRYQDRLDIKTYLLL